MESVKEDGKETLDNALRSGVLIVGAETSSKGLTALIAFTAVSIALLAAEILLFSADSIPLAAALTTSLSYMNYE